MTDDSAIGDAESTAHDGDLDSDSEYRHRPLYYPSLADSPSGSDFTVTNMDADELRKSQRKKKTPQIVIQQPTTGTYDSEDDDDDASTPSGENTDRNPMSLFSVSSESLDQLVSRERYLQSTFESMSGAETEHHTPSNKTSYSSKFLTNSGNRNVEAINAVKLTRSDPEAMKKRQELSKRIAETKKKLESVGHSSPLRYSQSIHDLSHIPERDKWSKKQVYVDDTSSPDSSLRRSCSLSDLSMQNIPPKRKQSEPSKKPPAPARMTPRYVKNNSMMRSKSSMVLNQHSDSENDSQEKKMSRLMRPTISSHNKMNQKTLQSRKKQSYSTSNLNQVGVDNISTSDDEEAPKKPQVPPRMSRQQSFENGQTSKRHMNNKDPKRASRHSMIHFDDTLTNEDPDLSSESVDLSSIEFSNQLCEDVSRQLVTTADNVVKIYQKLKESEDTDDSQSEALDCIKMSLIRTHKVVHDCIFNEFRQNNGNMDVNQTDAIKKLNDLVSRGATGSGSVIDLMQQYSDILLDMMQQKIHSANI